MAAVVIGRVGTDVVVPGEVCVKTGVRTREFVVLRGSTTPPWVHVLLIVTIVGWLWASAMAARRYRVEVPFVHRHWDRWRSIRRAALLLGLVGVILACWASVAGVPHSAAFLGLTVGAVVLGVGNSLVNTVGVTQRGDLLLLTRVDPDAVVAIRAGMTAARRVSHPDVEAGSA
ncbi:hypothetical protein [Pimelobacter simplex]|uniref:hypothetical protein n=1 Tax=Nocardioides simplex TaxID=2045 RepID=UPI003AABC53E